MSTAVRVLGFLAGLVALFGVAMAAGSAVGPVAETPAPEHAAEPHDGSPAEAGHGAAVPAVDPDAQPRAEVPGGLMVSQDGYTLRVTDTSADAGSSVPVSFVVEGPDGRPVTDFEVAHDKRLHLIAVRRDQSGFQHVHPMMADDGTWSTPLDLTAGSWRLFADFVPAGGDGLTLGADLSVAGDYSPAPPKRTARVDRVGTYTVRLTGELVPGTDAELTLSVSRDGRPVTDLQPYLGAYGHLVALREGDLAYLHVHPEGEPGDGRTEPGPDITFYAAVPSSGGYRLYLDFRHGGVVRTAEFAVGTSDAPARPSDTDGHDDSGGHDTH